MNIHLKICEKATLLLCILIETAAHNTKNNTNNNNIDQTMVMLYDKCVISILQSRLQNAEDLLVLSDSQLLSSIFFVLSSIADHTVDLKVFLKSFHLIYSIVQKNLDSCESTLNAIKEKSKWFILFYFIIYIHCTSIIYANNVKHTGDTNFPVLLVGVETIYGSISKVNFTILLAGLNALRQAVLNVKSPEKVNYLLMTADNNDTSSSSNFNMLKMMNQLVQITFAFPNESNSISESFIQFLSHCKYILYICIYIYSVYIILYILFGNKYLYLYFY